MHVHVSSPDGEAKFWLEPVVALEEYHGLSRTQLRETQKIIEEHQDEIKKSWRRHFER